MGLARRVNHTSEEVFLNNFAGVNITEGGNLLSMLVSSNLDHFPAEENFDSSLLALLKGDLVGIWELVDLLVGSPVLNLGILGSATL